MIIIVIINIAVSQSLLGRLLEYMNRYHFRHFWSDFQAALHCINRQGELKRLIHWARGRQLRGPQRLYESRLAEEENRFLKHRLRNPKIVRWACLIHIISNAVSPTPRYLPPGSAMLYRHPSTPKNSAFHRNGSCLNQ